MKLNPIVAFSIKNLGKNVKPANGSKNYCCFDEEKIEKILAEREAALPEIEND